MNTAEGRATPTGRGQSSGAGGGGKARHGGRGVVEVNLGAGVGTNPINATSPCGKDAKGDRPSLARLGDLAAWRHGASLVTAATPRVLIARIADHPASRLEERHQNSWQFAKPGLALKGQGAGASIGSSRALATSYGPCGGRGISPLRMTFSDLRSRRICKSIPPTKITTRVVEEIRG